MAAEPVHRESNDQSFEDTAFEPQSGFMFDEPADQDEFHTMQRNIESLNVLSEHNAGHDFQHMLDGDVWVLLDAMLVDRR